jgi:hypothetical protein
MTRAMKLCRLMRLREYFVYYCLWLRFQLWLWDAIQTGEFIIFFFKISSVTHLRIIRNAMTRAMKLCRLMRLREYFVYYCLWLRFQLWLWDAIQTGEFNIFFQNLFSYTFKDNKKFRCRSGLKEYQWFFAKKKFFLYICSSLSNAEYL